MEQVADEKATRAITSQSQAIVVFREPDGSHTIRGGETVFLLRSQDLTADLLVDLWAVLNQRLREMVAKGMSPEMAVHLLRRTWDVPDLYVEQFTEGKLQNAVKIARAMRSFHSRKVAD